MQAAQGDNNQQTMETNVAAPTEKQLDKAEVVVLLEQIERLIQDAGPPAQTKKKQLRT